MPLTIHILDQTDRGATIKESFTGACGSDEVRVEHIQSDCETQPGCDLALVHGNDQAVLGRWCKKAKLVVLYTGGSPRADADEFWIQRPLQRGGDLSTEEYQSLVALARDPDEVPAILRADKPGLKEEWRDVLIRIVVLGWIFRDSSRVSRLSDADRRLLVTNCMNKALPKDPLTLDKSDVEKLDTLRKRFDVPIDSKVPADRFAGAVDDLYDTARKLLGALR